MALQPNVKTIPTSNSMGATVLLVNQAARGGRSFTPYYFYIPTAGGTGNRIVQVNEAVVGRLYVPEPSVTASTSKFEGSSIDLPDGFVGVAYSYTWKFLGAGITVSFDSGSIPPGLHFRMLDSVTWTIRGTPTQIGTYAFTLKSVSDGGEGFLDFVVRILKAKGGRGGTSYVGGN